MPSKDKKIEKVYYSALVKAALAKPDDPAESVQNLDQVMSYFFCKIYLSTFFLRLDAEKNM